MFSEEPRTPTYLWLEAKIRELTSTGVGVYVTHKGEKMSGLVLLKLSSTQGDCKLLTQQRDLDGVMGWFNVFQEDAIEEKRADEYITRSIGRDPDLWVVEIEDKQMINPFVVV